MDPALQAIDAAVSGRWSQAEEINKQILEENPCDKEALNRLARASLELGKLSKAISNYKKVLKIDPYNNIAQKALQKLEALEANKEGIKVSEKKKGVLTRAINGDRTTTLATSNLFIEEPGRTKTTSLIHLGENWVVSSLDSGEPVYLAPHAHRVSVETDNGLYIGRLADDLSRRIISLIREGNKYVCFVRSASLGSVKIFLRETFKAEKLQGIPSFPTTEKQSYSSYSPSISSENESSDESESQEASEEV